MMDSRHCCYFIALFFSLSLSGCGDSDSFRDLKAKLAKLDQPAGSSIPKNSLQALPVPVASQYQKGSSRTPFEEGDKPKQGTATPAGKPLMVYQLNLLRFVGTITKNEQTMAYILTPDNKVFEVGIGDTIGDHGGKIVKITQNKLEVIEQSNADEQVGPERIITLQLKEEN